MDNEEKYSLMRFLIPFLFGASLFALISFLMSGCRFNFKDYELKEDSLAEEILEEIIEHKTGLDVDLTPNSPEDEVEVSLPL